MSIMDDADAQSRCTPAARTVPSINASLLSGSMSRGFSPEIALPCCPWRHATLGDIFSAVDRPSGIGCRVHNVQSIVRKCAYVLISGWHIQVPDCFCLCWMFLEAGCSKLPASPINLKGQGSWMPHPQGLFPLGKPLGQPGLAV